MSNAASLSNKVFFKNFTSLVVKDQPISGVGNSEIILISINSTGTRLVNTRTDKSIRIWKCASERLVEPITIESAHQKAVESISWNPKTEFTFASAGRDEYIKLWKASNGTLEKEFKITKDSGAPSMCQIVRYSADGDVLCVVDRDSTVSICSVAKNYEKVQEYKAHEHIYGTLWFNSGHEFLIHALHDGTLSIYKLDDQEIPHYSFKKALTGHRSSATCLAIDPRGRYFAVGSKEGIISIWSTSSMLNNKVIALVDEVVSHVDVSRDGAYIAASFDTRENAVIFDTETTEPVFEVPNSLSGNSVLSYITWFPNKTAFVHTSDGGKTMTLMKKSEKA